MAVDDGGDGAMWDELSDCGIGEGLKRPMHVDGRFAEWTSRPAHRFQPTKKTEKPRIMGVGAQWLASVNFRHELRAG